MDWEGIYQDNSSAVFQFLLSMTNNCEDAEDLLQETFIRAMRAGSKLRDIGKVKSWLLAIARNLFLDNLKKKRVRGTVNYYDNNQEIFECVPDTNPNPAQISEQSDFKSRLRKILDGMSETYRTVFTLGVIQRLNYQEIEDITGWSPSMVKSNIFRARRKVAGELEEGY
ncbi:MAG: RNA polymerase sigma factor [candidate division Zixibacteria bacterium]|nr:RNA polymerase sigma factor [Candidatus Tariuqbacter arcticus]